MFRTVHLFTRARHSALDDADEDLLPETDEEPDDTESSASPALDHLVCNQSVVFSPTFQVPAFYFTIHDSTGSPLPLADILKSSLFRRHSFPENSATTSFALSLPDQNLPLLSQGDHPTLGTPSWYIHPCETASAIAELTEEINSESTMSEQEMSEEVSMVRWMEVWFMVLGSTVDLHS
ncbi:uncharacterized protein STEHIDRAFT_95331 [Stereum hirsutum FP-91666 SS1]|uniref:uncharacterized protein n=1 Tax=Stereum hirsutum (strain FP-91666) TaxID=721885 RepID=UPI0004409DF9|nr:uncharacterized protein STEHIDRAFT_95331 [Stereum hirsutum FP-91666 SS1]EIM88273.1 hypothetical protein STEHIDRAFT_95331 [Stereum hirsutum FP-91666 SS1]